MVSVLAVNRPAYQDRKEAWQYISKPSASQPPQDHFVPRVAALFTIVIHVVKCSHQSPSVVHTLSVSLTYYID